jgi:hypothetical protein
MSNSWTEYRHIHAAMAACFEALLFSLTLCKQRLQLRTDGREQRPLIKGLGSAETCNALRRFNTLVCSSHLCKQFKHEDTECARFNLLQSCADVSVTTANARFMIVNAAAAILSACYAAAAVDCGRPEVPEHSSSIAVAHNVVAVQVAVRDA